MYAGLVGGGRAAAGRRCLRVAISRRSRRTSGWLSLYFASAAASSCWANASRSAPPMTTWPVSSITGLSRGVSRNCASRRSRRARAARRSASIAAISRSRAQRAVLVTHAILRQAARILLAELRQPGFALAQLAGEPLRFDLGELDRPQRVFLRLGGARGDKEIREIVGNRGGDLGVGVPESDVEGIGQFGRAHRAWVDDTRDLRRDKSVGS